jgi:glycosyltransferase involved in cell wall biosynthesis
MILILHGWLLEGSGSNLWTRSIITALARSGETVHLVCQENHPDRYEAIAEAYRHRLSGNIETKLSRTVPFPGKCILHQPEIGDTLPVFVKDKYEEYDHVVPMIELPDDVIETYIERNVNVVRRIAAEHDITAIHANHAVLMSVVAERVSAETGIPFVIMPHGSDIEYAVKKDDRFKRYASSAMNKARTIFVIGDEMRSRVRNVFAEIQHIEDKLVELHLGVDASQFEPIPRESRPSNIRKLADTLAGQERGKLSAHYNDKLPDPDVEQKLESIDWLENQVLLFTGRIISQKGIQSIIAALPLILDRTPRVRLIVVGHGPLREPMQSFLTALQNGDRDRVREIVATGQKLEGSLEQDARDDLPGLTSFFEKLERRGETDRYFDAARRLIKADTVVFTGYLTHRELRFLFPCCDVGIFPSIVREAGPLVFLESLASGCFPLGTYFGGMAASIDAVSRDLPGEVGATMKLSLDETVESLVEQVPRALSIAPRYSNDLARIARERYDWTSVADTFLKNLCEPD